MAEAMIGFGIGLSGTPKDYTSLIAAQERQRAADEAAAKKQKLQQYQDVAKGLVVDKSLPYQKEDYIIKLGDTLQKVKKAIDSGDYNAQVMALGDFSQFSKERKAEYDAFENYRNMYNKGQINPDIKVTPDQIYNAKTRQEVADLSGGDFSFNPDLGILNFYSTNKYDLVQAYKKAAETVPTQTWKTVQIPDAYGGKMTISIPNEDEYAKNLQIEWNTNRDARENAIRNYKRKNNLSGRDYDTPEEMQDLFQKAEEDYLKEGLEWGLKQKYNVIRKSGKGLSFSVSVGGAKEGTFGDWTQQPLRFKFITMKGEESTGGYDDSWGMTFGKTEVSMPNTTGYKDLNTGKDIGFTIGDNIKAQGVYVLPVYKKDSQITVGKNAKKAGEIVLPYNLDKEARAGNVEYKLIATGQGTIMPGGTDEQGRPIEENVKVYRPFNEVMGAFSDGLSETEKKDWKNKYQEGLRLVNEENEKLKQLYGGGAAPAKSTGKTTPAPTSTGSKKTVNVKGFF